MQPSTVIRCSPPLIRRGEQPAGLRALPQRLLRLRERPLHRPRRRGSDERPLGSPLQPQQPTPRRVHHGATRPLDLRRRLNPSAQRTSRGRAHHQLLLGAFTHASTHSPPLGAQPGGSNPLCHPAHLATAGHRLGQASPEPQQHPAGCPGLCAAHHRCAVLRRAFAPSEALQRALQPLGCRNTSHAVLHTGVRGRLDQGVPEPRSRASAASDVGVSASLAAGVACPHQARPHCPRATKAAAQIPTQRHAHHRLQLTDAHRPAHERVHPSPAVLHLANLRRCLLQL
eukprot:3404957-Prymnesium_polylepis.2